MTVPYTIQLDPTISGIPATSNRTMLDLNSGALRVQQAGVDWGDAGITAYEAEQQTWGSSVAGFRVPNRIITIPLIIGGMGSYGTGEEAARDELHQKVALIQREGGWLKRQRQNGPAMYADVVNATLTEPDTFGEAAGVEPNVQLQLECLPDFYGDAITLDAINATGYADAVLTQSGVQAVIPGDHPARCEIAVKDTSGNQQDAVIWGFRSRYYSSSAPLFLDATSFSLLNGAATGTLAGAYQGKVVTMSSPPTGAWVPMASTGQLTHQGTYQVWARVYSQEAPQIQLTWAQGTSAVYETNVAATVPGSNAFYLLSLGQVRIDGTPDDPCQWNGVVSLYSTQGSPTSLDALWLQPLDESAGLLQWNPQPPIATVTTTLHPSHGANSAVSGGTAWTNPGNLDSGKSTPAYVTFPPDIAGSTEFLFATQFGFNIPSGATVQGVQAQIYRWTASGSTSDLSVQLLLAGSLASGGADRSKGAVWPFSPTWATFGGATDLWGQGSLTPAQVNNAGFGVALQASVQASRGSVTASVGHVKITVYYSLQSGQSTTQDAVVFANQKTILRHDGMWHYRSSVASPVSLVYGDLARVPPSGAEGRAVELLVKPTRGDAATLPDSGIDALQVTLTVRPCYLLRP